MSRPRSVVLCLAASLAILSYFQWSGGEPDASHPSPPPSNEEGSSSPFSGRRALVEDPAALGSPGAPGAPGVSGASGAERPGRAAIRRNNDATERIDRGDLEGAIRILTLLVEEYPAQVSFAHNLAEALIRSALLDSEARSLEVAIGKLERALRLEPEREDAPKVRALLERWRAERQVERDHWTEDSPLFELSYSTAREDILHHSQIVLDHLGACYDELVDWFAADPVRGGARGRVRVVLHRREAFGELTGLGDWAGGAFDGTVRVAVEDLLAERSSWRRTLRHELVHVFVEALGGRGVPGWLNEGLAQVLEEPRAAGPQPGERPTGEWFSLGKLQGSLASWEDPEEIARAYLQSELLVRRIRRDYGDEALRRMVSGYAQDRSAEASFEAYTSVPLTFVLARLAEE